MFSVEIKINGALIAYIYGQNMGLVNDSPDFIHHYKYNYFRPNVPEVISGNVNHVRAEGIEKLVNLILKDIIKAE